MCDPDEFRNPEDRPTFVGPRISPHLRIRRLVAEENLRDEQARRASIDLWVETWRRLCEAAGGNPKPSDLAIVRRARADEIVDYIRQQYGVEAARHLRREDEKWLP
jgi:hypothetical protein